MSLRFKIVFLLSSTIWSAAFSQKAPEIKKGTYLDSSNRYFHNLELPAYLFISPSEDEDPVLMPTKNIKTGKGTLAPFYFNKHGRHVIHYFGNEEVRRVIADFVVFADGRAPRTNVGFKFAPKFISRGKVFYGKGLNLAFIGKDEMSGINQTYYSLNNGDYKELEEDQLPMTEEGEQFLQFLSADNVGNMENPQKRIFIIDLTPPKTAHNVLGISEANVISAKTKLYLTTEDNLSGVAKTFYQIDEGPKIVYKKGIIPIIQLKDGDHTLTYYSVDNVWNEEEPQTFKFYLDKTAPITTIDAIGDKYIVNDKIFFSDRTKLKLSATDNKSGVKDLMYSVDGDHFQKYVDPFTLPSKSGNHVVKYYASDFMVNQGDKVNYSQNSVTSVIYVDSKPPVLSYQFVGPKFKRGNSVYISNKTELKLNAFDAESGMQKITYTIDGGKTEVEYDKPFTLDSSQLSADVQFYAYDNVNNRQTDNFKFLIDDSGPELFYKFSVEPLTNEDGTEVYPSYVTLFAGASDNKTGNESIFIAINGSPEVPYSGALNGFVKDKTYNITFRAVDKLGNQTTQEVVFKTDKY